MYGAEHETQGQESPWIRGKNSGKWNSDFMAQRRRKKEKNSLAEENTIITLQKTNSKVCSEAIKERGTGRKKGGTKRPL